MTHCPLTRAVLLLAYTAKCQSLTLGLVETRPQKVFSKGQNHLEKQETRAASKYPEDGVLPEGSQAPIPHVLIALGCVHS